MKKIAGSGSASGSISQRHGSADPDLDPDPPQNVMDPQHCLFLTVGTFTSVFKDNKSLRVHKTVESTSSLHIYNVFLMLSHFCEKVKS
jgi:hypothetical protein